MIMETTDQIIEVLLMLVCCDKRNDTILRVDNKIQTGQKHRSTLDEDMSDFAVGFYEIIYKDILNSKSLLNDNGYLLNKEFAGDTINSFNTIANITPGAGRSRKQRTPNGKWPEYLQDYHEKYHCLANFWLIPMEMGRTTKGILNKAKKPINDYMDCFLEIVHLKIKFDCCDREYFKCFSSWRDFASKHFLINSYMDQELKIDLYSQYQSDKFIEKVFEKIELRAECIVQSECAKELTLINCIFSTMQRKQRPINV